MKLKVTLKRTTGVFKKKTEEVNGILINLSKNDYYSFAWVLIKNKIEMFCISSGEWEIIDAKEVNDASVSGAEQ